MPRDAAELLSYRRLRINQFRLGSRTGNCAGNAARKWADYRQDYPAVPADRRLISTQTGRSE